MSTVAIVGTVNHDVLVSEDGRRRESLGGILYNTVPMAALLDGTGFRVRPIARLGEVEREHAVRVLARFPAVDPDGLVIDASGTNRCVLDYSRGADRCEEVEMRVNPLAVSDLQGVRGARAVLVNMISGRDVSLEVLRAVRRDTVAPFLLDIQALARSAESPRRPCLVPEWESWCEPFEVVRGNEEEIGWFAGAPNDIATAITRILERGPSEVLVTRGERGAHRGILDGEGRLRLEEIPTFPRPAEGDPTGCGDAFLAGVCTGRLVGLGPAAAARLGSWTAAQVAGSVGLEGMLALGGLRERAAAADAEFAALLAVRAERS